MPNAKPITSASGNIAATAASDVTAQRWETGASTCARDAPATAWVKMVGISDAKGVQLNALALVRFGRLIVRRQLRAFAEKVLFHLLEQKLLGLRLAQVEAVLVHDHLHVFHPPLPCLFPNILVDALT